jgi:hypothetical protein
MNKYRTLTRWLPSEPVPPVTRTLFICGILLERFPSQKMNPFRNSTRSLLIRERETRIGSRYFGGRKNKSPEDIIDGIYPPIPTIFHTNGSLHISGLQANIKSLLAQSPNLKGIVVLGSNGEYPHLSSDEKLNILESARAVIFIIFVHSR